MKKTPLILSIISLVAVLALAIAQFAGNGKKAPATEGTADSASLAGEIVYFNLDRVFNEYDMANDLSSVVQTKMESISQEINRRQTKLQNEANSFQEKINKGLLTSSVAEVQYQKLQQQDREFQSYYNDKQAEMSEEQSVMLNQIADAINTFLEKYQQEKQYAMIISTQGDLLKAPVAAADSKLDVTDDIITRLNEEYIKTKNENK